MLVDFVASRSATISGGEVLTSYLSYRRQGLATCPIAINKLAGSLGLAWHCLVRRLVTNRRLAPIFSGHKMINARSETVAEKPAFRDPFRTQRCLIPANGFYEWSRHKKTKQPFHFGMRDDSLFAFAGIWNRWNDAQGGFVETCSILTTTPNSLLLDVHDRMPVILELH